MGRGGKRAGAGRKKAERNTDANVAVKVLKKQQAESLWNELVENDLAILRTTKKSGPLRDTLRYLEDRAFGRPVDNVNHVHDKPIEMNVNLSIAEIVRKVRERKENYERSR